MLPKPTSQLRTTQLTLIGLLLFVVLFVFFVYTFLHEGGHALVGLLFGQALTEFNVNFWDFSAHVSLSGGLTQAQRALQSIAGAGLPLLIWLGLISLAPRKASFTLEALKLIGTMGVLNTLLVWIVLPILYLYGQAPSDDVTNFLRYSGMQPLLLSGLAAAAYLGGWALFLSKIEGLRQEVLLFRQTDLPALTAGARPALTAMLGIMTVCLALTVLANAQAAQNPLGRLAPPADFQLLAEYDLSAAAYPDETLAAISLRELTYVGVFVRIENINTTYLDLRLTGADGFESVVIHGEGYRADLDGGLWEQTLPPGEYRLVLRADQSPGTISIYWNAP